MKIDTPIYDFLKKYSKKNISRFHMPGHKGYSFLGCENMDITEVFGADSLFEASGIIRKSEENATKLFESGSTFYSTEGSSLCIRAMLYSALISTDKKHTILAVRNAHKSFIYACAALDIDIEWIYPKNSDSLCSGSVTCDEAEEFIKKHNPFALYVTSPNYLGEMTNIEKIAKVCKKYDIPLLVDNAHGAYLKFTNEHPILKGAAMCCDSAHKTLPVLTGGAYLHISKEFNDLYSHTIKKAMSFFASTSPSYLILASLDCCNRYLADNYEEKLSVFIKEIDKLKVFIKGRGFTLFGDEPLKITVKTDGVKLAEIFRQLGGECEYCDSQFIVFMLSLQNSKNDLKRLKKLFEISPVIYPKIPPLLEPGIKKMSVREAIIAKQEDVKISEALNRICASPTVSCPPAVPIAVSGEEISENMLELFKFYNFDTVSCIKNT